MRACGSCTLCCKVSAIKALRKPQGVWCQHARPGQGCAIHGRHPNECKAYSCAWLLRGDLADDWKPSQSRIVLRIEGTGVFAHVDPGAPTAWRKEPYYSRLKRVSRGLWEGAAHVVVYVGHDITVIFPEEDLHIGLAGEGDRVVVGYRRTPITIQPHVQLVGAGGETSDHWGAVHPLSSAMPFA